jgi:hypothetical protein
MTIFRDIASCSLVEINRHFRGAYCLYHQGEPSCISTRKHGRTSQKTVIFTAMRTWNLTRKHLFYVVYIPKLLLKQQHNKTWLLADVLFLIGLGKRTAFTLYVGVLVFSQTVRTIINRRNCSLRYDVHLFLFNVATAGHLKTLSV